MGSRSCSTTARRFDSPPMPYSSTTGAAPTTPSITSSPRATGASPCSVTRSAVHTRHASGWLGTRLRCGRHRSPSTSVSFDSGCTIRRGRAPLCVSCSPSQHRRPPSSRRTTGRRSAPPTSLADHPQVGLVGFDDFELAAALRRPITVVSYDIAELARESIELLFERLAGLRSDPVRRTIRTRLIVRDT